MNGFPLAEIAPKQEVIFLLTNDEHADCYTVAEARQIRDWLTQALPCEHKGARNGTMKWNEPTKMTCNECGAEVPSFYTTRNYG